MRLQNERLLQLPTASFTGRRETQTLERTFSGVHFAKMKLLVRVYFGDYFSFQLTGVQDVDIRGGSTIGFEEIDSVVRWAISWSEYGSAFPCSTTAWKDKSINSWSDTSNGWTVMTKSCCHRVSGGRAQAAR